jgi:cellobiose PTS system EIIC component
MLEKFAKFLDEKLSTPMAKLAEQRHLRAVRDGIIATLPLIIVGSFFLIVAFPPLPESWAITEYLSSNAAKILLPYRMTMYIMTLYVTFGIGYSLAKSYKLDPVTGGILASMAFLLTLVPQAADGLGLTIPMGNLGSAGMFVGIIVSIFAVEILRLTTRTNFRIRMPEQVPDAVARSFEALTPTAIIILIIGSLTYFVEFEWHKVIGEWVKPLVDASDTLPSVLIIVLLITFFWSFGIHGASIVGTLARPLWLTLLEQNSNAQAAGDALPNIAAEPFYQWFIWIGGSGATIGLVILLATITRSKYAKTLGRTAFLPGIFNINEPLVFGAPIVLNPILIIPFIIAPLANAVVAWFATSWGLVNAVTVTAPWTLPGPIGSYLATGGDWRAIILNLVCIGLSVVVYYPFVKLYDNKLLREEQVEVEALETVETVEA